MVKHKVGKYKGDKYIYRFCSQCRLASSEWDDASSKKIKKRTPLKDMTEFHIISTKSNNTNHAIFFVVFDDELRAKHLTTTRVVALLFCKCIKESSLVCC